MIRQQQGVALITALLVVSLAVTAAVAMASRQQVDIRYAGNMLQSEQAYLYVTGMESWACRVLKQDAEDNESDNASESWADVLPPIVVEGGEVGGRIEDMQGRFNLNSLLHDGEIVPAAVSRFRRLLVVLGLEPGFADSLADWLDSDGEVRFPNGAEDSVYLGMDNPYRSANTAMASISELMLLPGMTLESYQKLAPYVSALPENVPINVNTAPAEVLMSLSSAIDSATADALISARGDDGFAKLDDFLQQPQLKEKLLPVEDLSVSSRYFMLSSKVSIGRVSASYQSLINRDSNGARVIMRAQGLL